MTPNTFATGATPEIEVLGDNFFATANVDLGSQKSVGIDARFNAYVGAARVPGQNVLAHSPHKLTFIFPSGLLPGQHPLVILTPEGKTAMLEQAFTLVGAGGNGSGGGPPLTPAGGGGTGSGGLTSAGGAYGIGGARGSGGSAGVPDLGGCTKLDYNATVYVFCASQGEMPRSTAKAACEAAGMTLVRIDSALENTFVGSTADSLFIDELWLQGSDEANEGVWVWQDGTQFWAGDSSGVALGGLYNNWVNDPPQPNDDAPSPGEDCTAMQANPVGNYGWFDEECTLNFGLVCEKVP